MSAPLEITDPSPHPLDVECDTLCRYLTGVPAAAAVARHYRRAHEMRIVQGPSDGAAFHPLDSLLVEMARGGVGLAAIADATAVLLAKGGLLRRKIVFLTALLESSRETGRALDTIHPISFARFAAGTALRGAAFAARALTGLILIAPLWTIRLFDDGPHLDAPPSRDVTSS